MLEQENDLSSGFERSSKNKDLSETDSALDSGFLSGPQPIYSGALDGDLDVDDHHDRHIDSAPKDKQSHSKQHQQQQVVDSGILTDTLEESGIFSSEMISSGTEPGLPDWFNNLSIKDSPSINNLDSTKEKLTASNQQLQQQQKTEANLWKLCYIQDNDGDTQLHLAIINEIPQIIWAIIRLAPAPWLLDIKNDDAQAPIHLAALTRQSQVVRRLLISGAKASIRDGDGNTALHLACMNNDIKTVEAILNAITPAELKEFQQTAAHQLAQSNTSCRQFSIDLDQRNFYGENCVHIAAQRGQIEILKLLIRCGADINAREGRAGYTPLHIAVEQQNFELTTFLLEHCKTVNTEQMCYRKITAYQLASELDHIEIMDILKKCGCKVISSSYDSDYEDSDESDVADSD